MTIDRDDNRPVHLREARMYTHDDDARIPEGSEYPSVTTVAGLVDKSYGLVPWAVKLTAEYWAEQFKSGAQIDVSTALVASKKAWKEKRDAAGRAGTLIHDWWNEYLGGNPDCNKYTTDIDAIPGATKTCAALKAWQDSTGYQQIGGEFVVVSSKLHTAGRVDSVGRFGRKNGKPVLTDLKTGSAVRSSALMQMGAYYLALKEHGIKVNRAVVLHAPLGCDKVREVHLTLDELKLHAEAFSYLRSVWSWFAKWGDSK